MLRALNGSSVPPWTSRPPVWLSCVSPGSRRNARTQGYYPCAPHPAVIKVGSRVWPRSITSSLWQTKKAELEEKAEHRLGWESWSDRWGLNLGGTQSWGQARRGGRQRGAAYSPRWAAPQCFQTPESLHPAPNRCLPTGGWTDGRKAVGCLEGADSGSAQVQERAEQSSTLIWTVFIARPVAWDWNPLRDSGGGRCLSCWGSSLWGCPPGSCPHSSPARLSHLLRPQADQMWQWGGHVTERWL